MSLPRAESERRFNAAPHVALAWIAAALLAAGAMLLLVAPAAAHAVLVESSPADGAAVSPAPFRVTLRFNEPVAPISIRLLDGAGHELPPAAPPSARDATIEVPLPGSLANGWYLISYRVTSQDSHPVAGSVAFRIGLDDTEAPRPMLDTKRGERADAALALGWLLRAVHFGGLLLAAGLSMHLALGGVPASARRSSLRLMVGAAAAGIAAATLLVGIGGVELEGGELASLLTASPWQRGADSSIGSSAGLAVLGLLGVIAGARADEASDARLIRIGGAMLGLASPTLTGHASTASPAWLMAPIVLIHTATAAFWLGGLWPLWHVVTHGPTADALASLLAFSRRATVAVAWLIGAAVIVSIVQLARADAFIDTRYGLLLIAKIGGVAGLVGLAGFNRWRLTPRLSRGDGAATRVLKRSIAAELALFSVVIALTAGLGSTPPPRAAPPPTSTLSLDASAGGVNASLRLNPARAGSNKLVLDLRNPEGAPLDVDEVEVSWALPVAGIEPFRRTATRIAPGSYVVETVTMLAPGRWHIGLEIWRDDFNRSLMKLEAPIGP